MLVLENPYAKKGYQEFAKYLKNHGRQQESDAFTHLITKRFGDAHGSNSSEKQSSNDQELSSIASATESHDQNS